MNAAVEDTRTLMSGATGRWASEQLLAAIRSGKPLSPAALRTNDTLRKDEWTHLDEALVEEGIMRLRVVAALMNAGLVITVPNAMGKTVFQWEKSSDMGEAEVSLSGVARSENDRQEYELEQIPLPITHKDFDLSLRALEASRNRGEALDTTQVRTAGRVVAEKQESMVFSGGPSFGGLKLYGLLNHPNRNIQSLGTNWDDTSVTGANILDAVLTGIAALEAERMFGPYWMVIPAGYSTKLEQDFKANGTDTIRQRLLKVDRLQQIMVADQLTANNVVIFQATRDVVAMVVGETLQTVQWDIAGGFIIKMKAFCIQVPLVRATAGDRCGVLHIS